MVEEWLKFVQYVITGTCLPLLRVLVQVAPAARPEAFELRYLLYQELIAPTTVGLAPTSETGWTSQIILKTV